MLKKKLKANFKAIGDYNKLFKKLKNEDGDDSVSSEGEIEEENDEIINKILDKYTKRCFGNTKIQDIYLQSQCQYDEDLESDLDCAGISAENSILTFCETCKTNELRVFCQHCMNKSSHVGHDVVPVKLFGICKNTFENLFNKKKEVERAIKEVNGSQAGFVVKFRDETFNLLHSFLKYCYNTKGKSEEEGEIDPSLCRLFNRIVDCLDLAVTKRVYFKIALGDCLMRNHPKTKRSLLKDIIDNVECWEDLIKVSTRMFNHLVIFPKFNQALVNTTLDLLLEYHADVISSEKWSLLLRLILIDPKAITSALNKGLFADILDYVSDTHLPEINVYYLQEEEEEEGCFEYLESTVRFFDITFSLHDYAFTFAKRDTNLDSLVAFLSNFQQLEYIDLKDQQDEYNANDIESLEGILSFEGYELIELFSNFLSEILKQVDSEKVLLSLVKRIKDKILKFNKKSNKGKRYFSPFVSMQRAFVLTLLALAGFTNPETTMEEIGEEESVPRDQYKSPVEITKSRLDETVNKIFKNPKECQKFFESNLSQMLVVFGFFREVYHKFHARFGDDELQELYSNYAEEHIMLSDCDYAFIQIALPYISEKSFLKFPNNFSTQSQFSKIFSLNVENFQEMSSTEKNFTKLVSLYKDYWSFLEILMANDVSISNILLRISPEDLKKKSQGYWEGNPHFESIRKAVKDIVFCLGSCNSETLNSTCLNYINGEIPLLPIARDFLSYDDKNLIFRLKKEDEKFVKENLNLSFLKRKETSCGKLIQNIVEMGMNGDFYLQKTQLNFFLKENFRIFLDKCGFFFACKRAGQIFEIFEDKKMVIEQALPLMNLTNIYLDLLRNEGIEYKDLSKNKKNFLQGHFIRKISKCEILDSSPHIKSYVLELHQKLKSFLPTKEKDQEEKIEEEEKPEKKKKKKSKKDKIKEKMRKRQQLMLDSLMPEDDEENEEDATKNLKRLESTCSYCLSPIEKDEEFTIPIFMRLVNINESSQKIQETKPHYIPLLSSCRHQTHLKCFHKMNLFKKTKKKKKIWFWQFNCLQCKKISNCYIANRDNFVDIDYVKDTFYEQVNNFNEVLKFEKSISKEKIFMDSKQNFCEFLRFLWQEILDLTLSNAYYDYFEVYGLILRDIEINAKKAEGGEMEEIKEGGEGEDGGNLEENILRKILEFRKGGLDNIEVLQAWVLYHVKGRAILDKKIENFENEIEDREIKFLAFIKLLMVPETICELEEELWVKFSNLALSDYEDREFYLKHFADLHQIHSSFASILATIPQETPNKLQIQATEAKEKVILKLPRNITELINTYIPKKCQICDEYTSEYNKDLILCIICGTVFCKGHCSEAEDNLIQHSTSCHSGSSCFISLIKVLKSHSIYIDDFGFSYDKIRNMQGRKIVFEYTMNSDFKLDSVREKRIKFMLKRRMLINEISLNSGKMVNLLEKKSE